MISGSELFNSHLPLLTPPHPYLRTGHRQRLDLRRRIDIVTLIANSRCGGCVPVHDSLQSLEGFEVIVNARPELQLVLKTASQKRCQHPRESTFFVAHVTRHTEQNRTEQNRAEQNTIEQTNILALVYLSRTHPRTVYTIVPVESPRESFPAVLVYQERYAVFAMELVLQRRGAALSDVCKTPTTLKL